MDSILLLLIHTMRGLNLNAKELLSLLKAGPAATADPTLCLQAEQSLAYIKSHPNWRQEAEQWIEDGDKRKVQWSRIGDDNYPLEWLMLANPPPVFCYQGLPSWRTTPLLAVVGSRTPMGESLHWLQRELAAFLKRHQVGVVSGGARGIDQWAHRVSIEANRPTVCLLPSGLLSRYPIDNEPFWSAVLESGGALISTFGLNQQMRKHYFHTRNRWITGLSPLLFVVEANRRSGSSMTASLAREEGRTVCTLPVFPHSPQGLANLDLIFNGCQLLRDHHDLASLWNLSSRPTLFQRANSKGEEDGVD